MMDTQTEAHIFLAEQRGRSETDFFRSYHTFNFGAYQDESRKPLGSLYVLNDDALRAGASLTMQVEQPMDVLLLPIVGGLEYSTHLLGETPSAHFLEPGQVGVLLLAEGMTYTVINPYETETISFLQIWLTRSPADFDPTVQAVSFDLTRKNILLPLLGVDSTNSNRLFIGQYTGRREGAYPVELGVNVEPRHVFVFVLQGVFEVANRLLHEKDALALTYRHSEVMEFEALSNNATLLLIELSD
jgi:hypothetical protein